jgi:hypothetical protein
LFAYDDAMQEIRRTQFRPSFDGVAGWDEDGGIVVAFSGPTL